MRINNLIWAIVLISTCLISCNRKAINQLQLTSKRNFDYFVGKGKIKFVDEKNNKQTATLQLKIQKDSVIWGNVSKSVIQVARFSVLNDSLFFINKLERKYIPKSINSLSQGIDIQFTEPMMENLLLGNLILPINENTKIRKHKIAQKQNDYLISSELDKETKKITSVDIIQSNTKNKIEITYENYQKVKDLIYPKKITIYGEIQKENIVKNSITIEFHKVSTPSKKPSFPFKVPVSYEKL